MEDLDIFLAPEAGNFLFATTGFGVKRLSFLGGESITASTMFAGSRLHSSRSECLFLICFLRLSFLVKVELHFGQGIFLTSGTLGTSGSPTTEWLPKNCSTLL